jgi:threonine/homoserine/homoserine lactone efflux protein
MRDSILILTIAGALLLGAISPGPSFVVVVRTSVAASRKNGLAVALGMGVGGVVFGALALIGLNALLSNVEWLYLGLKVLGGCYLGYLAIQLWRKAAEPLAINTGIESDAVNVGHSFRLGFVTQISNPKTAVVYGSILAALLPPAPSIWLALMLLPTILLIESSWYSMVALAFSSDRARALYLRTKPATDRVAGSVLGLLGLRLALDTSR